MKLFLDSDSIQIQLFKMFIASKFDLQLNLTINISSQFGSQITSALQTSFQINSQFNLLKRWTWCFMTYITTRPLSPFILGLLYTYTAGDRTTTKHAVKFWPGFLTMQSRAQFRLSSLTLHNAQIQRRFNSTQTRFTSNSINFSFSCFEFNSKFTKKAESNRNRLLHLWLYELLDR